KALREQGDDPAEHQALEGALAIDQRHFMALVRLAELHERQGDLQRSAQRWSNVLAMAAMMDQLTPAIEMMLDHARAQVALYSADFAETIDTGLASARASV